MECCVVRGGLGFAEKILSQDGDEAHSRVVMPKAEEELERAEEAPKECQASGKSLGDPLVVARMKQALSRKELGRKVAEFISRAKPPKQNAPLIKEAKTILRSKHFK
jgi:hypothetical protein